MNIINTQEADSAAIRRDVLIFGGLYGMVAGIALAMAQWGLDAVRLSQMHVLFPWLKLVVGILVCGLIGFVTGWLVSRKEGGCLSFIFWLIASLLLAWAALAVPLQIVPAITKSLEPELTGFVSYQIGDAYTFRFLIALVWIVIFTSIAGILQSTLIDSAVFSISVFGKVAPFLVCTILLGIAGFVIDDLVNVPFRGAYAAIEQPVFFILEHHGEYQNSPESRAAHAGAFSSVRFQVTEERHMIVSRYDEDFWRLNVLVRFDDAWVECVTFNKQASFCKLAEPIQ